MLAGKRKALRKEEKSRKKRNEKAKGKAHKEPVQEPPKDPDCVPGSLSKAFAFAGDAEAAAIVMLTYESSFPCLVWKT